MAPVDDCPRARISLSIAQATALPLNRVALAGAPIFTFLNKSLIHAQARARQETPMEVQVGDIEPKAKLYEFLVQLLWHKRIYRKQISAAVGILTQAHSWKKAAISDKTLFSSLPVEWRVHFQNKLVGNVLPVAKAVLVDKPKAGKPAQQKKEQQQPKPAESFVGLPASTYKPPPQLELKIRKRLMTKDTGASSRYSPGSWIDEICSTTDAGSPGSPGNTPQTPTSSTILVIPGITSDLSVPMPGQRTLTAQEVEVLRKKLRRAIEPVVAYMHGAKGLCKLEIFNGFRMAMQKTQGANAATLIDILDPLDHKPIVMAFLARCLKDNRRLRSLIASIFARLLQVDSWNKAVPQQSPKDLHALRDEVGRVNADMREAEKAAADRRTLVASCRNLPLPDGAGSRKSIEESRETALAVAHQRILSLCVRDDFLAVAVSDMALLYFESFLRAMCRFNPEGEEAAIFDRLEPKRLLLDFLIRLGEHRKKAHKRVSIAVRILSEREAWKHELDRDGKLYDMVHDFEKNGLVNIGDGVGYNLKERAQEVVDLGCGVGLLSIRVIAGHHLGTCRKASDWIPNPYVRVTLGKSTAQTETTTGFDPVWLGNAFVLVVPSTEANVTFEVWDSANGQRRLGLVNMYAATPWSHRKAGRRFPLLEGPKAAKLELQLNYEGKKQASNEGKALGFALRRGRKGSFGLCCPAGHPIDKKKEGLKWHQAWTEHSCSVCKTPLNKKTLRWRCSEHCDFDVCDKCYQRANGTRQKGLKEPAGPVAKVLSGAGEMVKKFKSGTRPKMNDEMSIVSVLLPKDGMDMDRKSQPLFCLDVHPKVGNPWRVFRSYDDFSKFSDRLGPATRKWKEAVFPSKGSVNQRTGLEKWMQHVIRQDAKAWIRPMAEFCDPGHK